MAGQSVGIRGYKCAKNASLPQYFVGVHMDNVRMQLFKHSEEFEFQLQKSVDAYAKFQRGIVQNDIKLTDIDKKEWLLMCRKLRKDVTEKLEKLDSHTVFLKNFFKIPDLKDKKS